MGPIQSFSSSYKSNLDKRRKTKHKPFNSANGSSISGELIIESISIEVKLEIAADTIRQEKSTKRKLVLAVLITSIVFVLGIYSLVY